jgi:hypothetical protein
VHAPPAPAAITIAQITASPLNHQPSGILQAQAPGQGTHFLCTRSQKAMPLPPLLIALPLATLNV